MLDHTNEMKAALEIKQGGFIRSDGLRYWAALLISKGYVELKNRGVELRLTSAGRRELQFAEENQEHLEVD